MDNLERLQQQLNFIIEMDKLKSIIRQSRLIDRSRNENDAEHSWHLAIMALLLREHANDSHLDILKVIKMLLVHDIVEIDAGDTFAYDEIGHETKAQREEEAAQRLFGMLPVDQADAFHQLWQEFEARETSEVKFAASLDRLQPMLLNYHTEGAAWRQHGITSDKVIARNSHIAEGSEKLWKYAETFIRDAVAKGYLKG